MIEMKNAKYETMKQIEEIIILIMAFTYSVTMKI